MDEAKFDELYQEWFYKHLPCCEQCRATLDDPGEALCEAAFAKAQEILKELKT